MALIVFALVSTVLLFILFILVISESLSIDDIIISGFLLTLGIFIPLIILLEKPTAMDVYKGKTTLEITYEDGVAIDSTVVWKK